MLEQKKLIRIVAKELHLNKEDITGTSKKRHLVEARNIIIRLLHLQDISLQEIGRLINRHHTTIMHSLESTDFWLKTDKKFKGKYERCKKLSDALFQER